MRRIALLAVLFAVGCGGSDQPRTNRLRPAPPVTLTGAIHSDRVQISPGLVGAGQIIFVVSNQSGAPQTLTVESDDVATRSGNRASSPAIPKGATGRVTINARQGTYAVHVRDRGIREARLRVGPPRKSGQNDLLLP